MVRPMTTTLTTRSLLAFVAVTGAVLLCGAMLAIQPMLVFALIGAAIVLRLAFAAPVLNLVLLIALTAIVPFGLQNRFGIGGGTGAPGLLLSDALLAAGLARAGYTILRKPLERRLLLPALLVAAFMATAGLQAVRGLALGRDLSTVGAEFRVLLGFGTFLVALPILADRQLRNKLLRSLPVVGLMLGLWGIGQWVFDVGFAEAGDAGVREGIRLTSSGRGQIQGGLYAYPVAVVLSLTALTAGHRRSLRSQALLAAVGVLNVIALLLTYERTFWVATVLAFGFTMVKAGGAQRLRGLIWAGTAVILMFAALSTLAPGELGAARERLLSLSQYGSDNSVQYRLVESRHVLHEISSKPWIGSGLAATIFWGRPWVNVPPETFTFSHNGYLWLIWKVGIFAALLLWIPLGRAIVSRTPAEDDELFHATRHGCQGALLVLIVVNVTFPAFSQIGIAPTMGLLMAVALATRTGPPSRATEHSASGGRPTELHPAWMTRADR